MHAPPPPAPVIARRAPRSVWRVPVAFGVLLLVAACSEPYVIIPGNALSGEPSEPPASWAELATIETLQLETRPDDPYSVNLWAVGIGADLYIATRAGGTRWSENLVQDPRVRFRVANSIYSLVAHPVLEPQERGRVAAAYVAKYDLDEDGDWVADALIFRLAPR